MLIGLVGMTEPMEEADGGLFGVFPGEAGRADERSGGADVVAVGKLMTSNALGRTKMPW